MSPQVEGARNKVILVKDALSKLSRQQYTIEELTSKPLPEGVDPLHLESYLSDKDFQVTTPPKDLHTCSFLNKIIIKPTLSINSSV